MRTCARLFVRVIVEPANRLFSASLVPTLLADRSSILDRSAEVWIVLKDFFFPLLMLALPVFIGEKLPIQNNNGIIQPDSRHVRLPP